MLDQSIICGGDGKGTQFCGALGWWIPALKLILGNGSLGRVRSSPRASLPPWLGSVFSNSKLVAGSKKYWKYTTLWDFPSCKTVRLLTQISLWNGAFWFILATRWENKDPLSQSRVGPCNPSYLLPLSRGMQSTGGRRVKRTFSLALRPSLSCHLERESNTVALNRLGRKRWTQELQSTVTRRQMWSWVLV